MPGSGPGDMFKSRVTNDFIAGVSLARAHHRKGDTYSLQERSTTRAGLFFV